MLRLEECKRKLTDFKGMFGKRFGIVSIGIFGSVARQENTADSDIDIVVEVERPSLTLMYELKESLKKLFDCEVDLIRFRESLRPLLKNNILNDVETECSRWDQVEDDGHVYNYVSIIISKEEVATKTASLVEDKLTEDEKLRIDFKEARFREEMQKRFEQFKDGNN